VGQVDFERLGWLAAQVSHAAQALDDGCGAVDRAPLLAGSSLGDTDGAGAALSAYQGMAGTVRGAARNLAAALASDVDRLGSAVAAYRDGDKGAAERVLAAGGSLDVFTAHVHSGGSPADDYIRGAQLDRYADAVADGHGPTVATLDANVSRDEADQRANDLLAPQALDRFENELGYTDATEPVGPTHGDNRIDYVFTGPEVVTGDPQRVSASDDELSDHDGQALDVTVPRW
jgi:hypothetical protein